MRSRLLLASLAVLASTALGFEKTFPIVAWSDVETPVLATLAPSHPSHARAVFRPTTQTLFPAAATDEALCTLETILVISAPGLHSSDLSLLPAHSAIRTAVAASADSLSVPYVPTAHNSETAAMLAQRFVSECEATVLQGLASASSGERKRSVRVHVVEGLREWELTGSKARSMRREIVERIDALVGEHLESLPASHLVVLTSLPSLAAYDQAKLAKRQYVDSDELSYDADEFASGEATAGEYAADDDDEYAYFSPIESTTVNAFAPNRTSVFQPRANGGLLSRYVFFTAPLILCLLISIFILIPLLVFSTAALTSTETVAGLESKMTGTVGLDPSKA